MKLLKLWRTLQDGWNNFYRDGWLTIATVTIMTLALYIVSLTVVAGGGIHTALQRVQDRVTISVYFEFDVEENTIKGIAEQVAQFSEVEGVEYISRDRALSDFRSVVVDDPIITQTLDELDENPLNASLTIRAANPEDYESIARYFEENHAEQVSRVNFQQNRETIERLSSLVVFVRNAGLILGAIFIVIAMLITFNTIRMSMYAHRREYEIMRLVGASNLHVRMPSVFEGMFYGLAGALASSVLLAITLVSMKPFLQKVFLIDLVAFANFIVVGIGGMIFFGALLGVISSFFAIQRYLERYKYGKTTQFLPAK